MSKNKTPTLLEALESILHYYGSVHDNYLHSSIIMGEEALDNYKKKNGKKHI